MQIDELDLLHKPNIQSRIQQIKQSQTEQAQMQAILALFDEIRMASKNIVDGISSGIEVTNIDEITTSLHNELGKNTRLLLTALKDVGLSNDKQLAVLSKISAEFQSSLKEEIGKLFNQKPIDKVTILNPQDFPKTEEVSITNISEILDGLIRLEQCIENSRNITVPAPLVNVEAPNIVVQPTPVIVDQPDIDIESLLKSLSINLRKLRDNNKSNPMFVRMTDLDKVLLKLDDVISASKNVMLGFPGAMRIQNATGGMVDFNSIGGDVFKIVPKIHDYISLSYTGSSLTGVVYKTGGASGTTVATLALAYTSSNLTSVTRT